MSQHMSHHDQDLQRLRDQITTDRQTFLAANPDHGENPDYKDSITSEDVSAVLGYRINWGKYKGLTYQEILVRYPSYFHKTVMAFQKKHPDSYTWRCFAELFKLKTTDPLMSNPSTPTLGSPLPLKRQRASMLN